ncbi:MAG TPA: hypothetical protein VFK05_29940 [Polyangiaceae bacterium]|nr:hypothetical protein [Polyangiaceae bacterium]
MKRVLGALLCGWLLAPASAQGKSKPSGAAHLDVEQGPGTEHCLDVQSLSRAVESRLRRRVFRTDVPATLYLKIAFTRDAAGWSLLLTMHDGKGDFLGRRSLVTEAADCSALDESLALVVALLVDSPPTEVLVESEPAKAPANPANAPPAPAPAPASAPASAAPSEAGVLHLPRATPAPREPWRLQLAAEGAFAIGILPGFAPGLELGFGAKAPRLPEFRLFAGWYAPREQRRAELDAGARFDALYVGLEACPLEGGLGISQWSLCAGQSLGRVRVEAFGFDENSTSNHLSYALLARGALQLALGSHWGVRLGARAELPLTRGVFGYGTPAGEQALFQPSPVAAVLDLGLVVRL